MTLRKAVAWSRNGTSQVTYIVIASVIFLVIAVISFYLIRTYFVTPITSFAQCETQGGFCSPHITCRDYSALQGKYLIPKDEEGSISRENVTIVIG
ncbi:MAG: hypothetical protein HC945_00535, partial [Nitrosarchaeum sp.]|nr:hypothetical protein [Nitrosarchaeum sp.]